MSTAKEFFERPYMDRQLLVFVDDEVIKAEKEAKSRNQSASWIDVLNVVRKMVTPTPVLIIETVMTALMESKNTGVPITTIGTSAIKYFQLPPGHPRQNVLYVGHPANPTGYVPIADFHRFVFEHKFSEAVSILMHLGAKEINVEHVCGWGRNFSSKLNIGMPEQKVEASASAQTKRAHESKILYRAEFSGDGTPRLPESLVWYHHEPTWKGIADGKLIFGMKSFSLTLQYTEDYGVNAELKAKVAKSGFDLGGEFEKHTSTTWQLTGKF